MRFLSNLVSALLLGGTSVLAVPAPRSEVAALSQRTDLVSTLSALTKLNNIDGKIKRALSGEITKRELSHLESTAKTLRSLDTSKFEPRHADQVATLNELLSVVLEARADPATGPKDGPALARRALSVLHKRLNLGTTPLTAPLTTALQNLAGSVTGGGTPVLTSGGTSDPVTNALNTLDLGNTAGTIVNAAGNAVNAATNTAGDVVNGTKTAAEDLLSAGTGAAGSLVNATGDGIETLLNTAAGALNDANGTIQNLTNITTTSAGGLLNNTMTVVNTTVTNTTSGTGGTGGGISGGISIGGNVNANGGDLFNNFFSLIDAFLQQLIQAILRELLDNISGGLGVQGNATGGVTV